MSATKPVGFWGLVVEPDRMYSQVVPVSFKVTMAAIGPEAVAKKEGIKLSRSVLMLTHQKDGEFALCSLTPEQHQNQMLDLVFLEGETIHFRVVGENAVHLTGYYFEDAEASPEFDGGYDSEELEAEMNGEDIEDTDSEAADEDEDEDDEDEDEDDEEDDEEEEEDSEMDDFINDEELDDEDSDDESVEETVENKKKKNISHPRIREITSDEEEEEVSGDDFEVLSVTEDSQLEDSDEEELEEESDEDHEDEEVDSDEAGSVDMSPGKKMTPIISKDAKRVKVEVKSSPAVVKRVNSPQRAPASPATSTKDDSQKENLKAKTLPSGLKIEDIKLGAGIKAQKGRRVAISYTVSNENGKVIASATSQQPFLFNLGDNEIAKGIAIGVQGMALGGERKLIVPTAMIDEKAKPTLPKSGNCVINIKLESVQPAPKSQ